MEQQLILDRYRPLEELGQGGFATVTLAWDTRMHRRVAIKRLELPRDRTGAIQHDPPGLAEARTAAMLNHPAIVTVYDFETDFDEAFLIMEHVDGASLEEVLDDVGGALTLDETAAIFRAVSSALEFAHENGVLHLDVKSANVLVTRDGRVKVADFGMAELSSATGHGASFGGTIGYMPLEQLQGQPVSEPTDEWALAALTYECLTGATPFDADDIPSAIRLLEAGDTPPPSAYEATLSHSIDEILLAGTGLLPSDRYPSIASLAAALSPQLGDPEVGRDSLAELVQAYAEDGTAAEEPDWQRVGLWDRLRGGPAGGVALRAIAAVESGWLAWAGLGPTHLQSLPVLGAAALVALAGALAPSLGTGLGLLALIGGLLAQGMWLLASLFAVVAIAWWWLVARRGPIAAVMPLSAPVLGMAHVPFAMPLIAGFTLPAIPAAAAGFVGGLLQLLASAASSHAAPYAAVAPQLLVDPQRALIGAANVHAAFLDPAAWLALFGWPVAALLMSLFARRATRFAAILGALAGTAALVGAGVLARLASAAEHTHAISTNWTGTEFAVSLGGSLILMVLVAALGAPVRAEEEDLVRVPYEADE